MAGDAGTNGANLRGPTAKEGGGSPRGQRATLITVALAVAFSAYNLAVAALASDPRTWSSFPYGASANARVALAATALVTAALGFQLHGRRLISWLALTALLLWAAGGLVVTGAPHMWTRALAPLALAAALLYNQHLLTARSPWARNSLRAGAIYYLAAVVIVSLLGVRAIGGDFEPPIETWVQTFYYVTITFTTVGYGDIVPVTPLARMASVAVVGMAFTAIALAGAVLAPPILREHFKEVSMAAEHAATHTLKDHIIVAGASPEAHSLVRALQERDVSVVLLNDKPEFTEQFAEVDFPVIEGSPAKRESLISAGLKDALALVACDEDDAVNAFILLTAREATESARLVAMATDPGNVEKLRLAGADAIVSPSVVGGSLLGHAALGESGRVEDLWTGDVTDESTSGEGDDETREVSGEAAAAR